MSLTLIFFNTVFSGLITLLSIPYIRQTAIKNGLIEKPKKDKRKLQKKPMVRLGGISMVVGFTFTYIVNLIYGNSFLNNQITLIIFICSILIYLVGAIDDIFQIAPLPRLFFQILITSCAWQNGLRLNLINESILNNFYINNEILIFLNFVITVIWITGLTNAFNWLDGLDGLAAGICCLSAIGLFAISLSTQSLGTAYLSAIIIGICVGFLRYNFNPAKIYMGDGGSNFIGFLIASTSILQNSGSMAKFGLLPAFVLFSLPILDMFLVICGRILRGKSPFKPDNRHLHHKLLRMGLSHRNTVIIMYLFTSVITIAAFLLV